MIAIDLHMYYPEWEDQLVPFVKNGIFSKAFTYRFDLY